MTDEARLAELHAALAAPGVDDALREQVLEEAVRRIAARHRPDPQGTLSDRLARLLRARRDRALAGAQASLDLDATRRAFDAVERWLGYAPGWAEGCEAAAAEHEREVLRATRALGDAEPTTAARAVLEAAIEHAALTAYLDAYGQSAGSYADAQAAREKAHEREAALFVARLSEATARVGGGAGADVLRAVLAAPEDDAPRLVFADWTTERGGDPERGEYIVLACGLAQSRWEALFHPERDARARALLGKNAGRWIDELELPGLERARFARGFVEHAELRFAATRTWLAHLVARTPLASLAIVGAEGADPEALSRVLDVPAIDALRRIALPGVRLERAKTLALFARVGGLHRLRCVDLAGSTWAESGLLAMEGVAPTSIEELDLTDVKFEAPRSLHALLASPAYAAVRSLRMEGAHGDEAAAAAAKGTWPRLRALRLSSMTSGATQALAGADLRLEELALAPVADVDVTALASAPFVPRLVSLTLTASAPPTGRALPRLLARTGRLEELVLRGFALDARDVSALGACESLASLRSLDLSECRIDDAAVKALVEATAFAALLEVRALGVWTRLGTEARNVLVKRFPHVALHC